MIGDAIFSPCRSLRYRLSRGPHGNRMPVVMLNPSTAGADENDPTITRLLGFSERFGYDGIDVVNLYSYIATDPKKIRGVPGPWMFGPDHNMHVRNFIREHKSKIICAWGAHAHLDAVLRFKRLLNQEYPETRAVDGACRDLLSCFGTNRNGSPKHPLYLSYNTPLHPFFGV